MTDIAEFLLARIAEDEAAAREAAEPDAFGKKRSFYSGPGPHCDDWGLWMLNVPPARMLAECEAKRRIVEAESRWRRMKDNVIVSGRMSFDDWVDVTWVDERGWPHEERIREAEFSERFTEPSPPSETLRLLALPYADRPGYREEWRP